MINKLFFNLGFILLGFYSAAIGQQSFLTGPDIAVFYPANFDLASHLPSFALLSEPENYSNLPNGWEIIPEFYAENGKKCARIQLPENADLYGTGEGVGPLKRNNRDITLWNTDNYGFFSDGGKRLYQSHPWIMGLRSDGSAFGILIDNTWKLSINLSNPIEIISEGPEFRILVIEKPTPQELLIALADLTGTMEMPPLWALGYQQCRFSYTPDTRVREVADTFREKKIPCDVIWMDIDYMQDYKIFTFNSSGFPNPLSLNNYLHTINFKSVYMIDPGVKKQNGYFVYDQGTTGNHWVQNNNRQEYNGDVWPGSCAFPDFTRPETQTWWAGLFGNFMAQGIDGVWNDMNEPAVFNGPDGTMPENNYHRGGNGLPAGSHLRYHNVYGYLMVKSSREGILNANPDKRPFVLSRANFLGGQRFAATWTGDNGSTWDYFKLSIPMSLNLSMSGQPFNGPDIGGFIGNCNADLLAHWMAVGAFYPFCRNHSSSGTSDQEPWAFGLGTENASRVALERRYMLLPHLYTLFHQAATNGLPVMRPVFFADPKDLSLREEQEAFMWGDNLIIVPKWSINTALPSGTWRRLSINGEKSETDEYQPDLLLKGGSIIPVGRKIQSTVDFKTDSITLLVSLDTVQNANGTLYVDAGDGFGYKNGDYLITNFTASKFDIDSVQITCSNVEGDMVVPRVYRVGIVTFNNTFYTGWTNQTLIKTVIPKELYAKIISPTNNQKFEENADITVSFDVKGGMPVDSIELYNNKSIKIATIRNMPFTYIWEDVSPNLYTIHGKAYSGNVNFETDEVSILVGIFGDGKMIRQVWNNIPGTSITDFTNNARYPNNPDLITYQSSFKTPIDAGDNFGCRMFGYLFPPATGDYTFWISGDDNCQLNISTDSLSANKSKIAEVLGWTNPEEWDKYLSQKSVKISLEAGKKYFIEALQKEGSGGDNMAVAWEYANHSREIIPGVFLSTPSYILSIRDLVAGKFIVYPNPAKNGITVRTQENFTGQVEVIDLNGKVVINRSMDNSNSKYIELNGILPGIYFVKLKNKDYNKIQKIIVE